MGRWRLQLKTTKWKNHDSFEAQEISRSLQELGRPLPFGPYHARGQSDGRRGEPVTTVPGEKKNRDTTQCDVALAEHLVELPWSNADVIQEPFEQTLDEVCTRVTVGIVMSRRVTMRIPSR